MLKTVTLTAVLATTLMSASLADAAPRIHATDNFIEQYNKYDGSHSTTPGVRVRVDGKNTVHQIGDHGLTRNIIFDETGEAAEAWARDALGLDLDARICGSGGEDGNPPIFGGC